MVRLSGCDGKGQCERVSEDPIRFRLSHTVPQPACCCCCSPFPPPPPFGSDSPQTRQSRRNATSGARFPPGRNHVDTQHGVDPGYSVDNGVDGHLCLRNRGLVLHAVIKLMPTQTRPRLVDVINAHGHASAMEACRRASSKSVARRKHCLQAQISELRKGIHCTFNFEQQSKQRGQQLNIVERKLKSIDTACTKKGSPRKRATRARDYAKMAIGWITSSGNRKFLVRSSVSRKRVGKTTRLPTVSSKSDSICSNSRSEKAPGLVSSLLWEV